MRLKKSIFILIMVFSFLGCKDESTFDFEENNKLEKEIPKPSDNNLTWYKPSLSTTWQWQLLGNINGSYNVEMYDVDLFDTSSETIEQLHNDGKKVICYFSAGSYEDWRDDASAFPSKTLGNDMDGWDEKWLDIRDESVKNIMTKRLDLAKEKGCDGVEPDNMDGYIEDNNAGFSLTYNDQITYNTFIANEAHQRGLSVGLKNDLNQIIELEPYFDFAINEQCNYYNECSMLEPFIKNNKAVLNVEYDSKYIENDNAEKSLCDTMESMKFQTLVLPLNLDDSFRYSCSLKDNLFNSFGTGFGGANSFKFRGESDDIWVSAVDLMLDENIATNSSYTKIVDFNATAFSNLQSYLQNAKYFTMWITKGWEESWFNIADINRAIQNGKTPVFIYWYFGDTLVSSMPTDSEIEIYKNDNQKLKTFLDKINGTKLLILEPEFNKQPVLDNSSRFIEIISDTIDSVKTDNTLISLCMTDTGNRGVDETYEKCGYENCSLGDKYEWGLVKPIYDALSNKLDFISFQEMLSQFSRDPQNPGSWEIPNPKAYSDNEIGIKNLPKRLENITNYLYSSYKKPIFLPYITIATATWDDTNSDNKIDSDEINESGYEDEVDNFYKNLNTINLKENHLFGYSIMELFDNPSHDKNGYQYFMENEYHLGVIKNSTKSDENEAIDGNIEFKEDILDTIFKN